MTTKNFPLEKVAIKRDRETITTAVPAHEIRVLQVVHRPDNVKKMELAEDEHEEIELDTSAEAEYSRLQRRYRRVNAPDAVQIAYPGGPDDLAKHGFSTGHGTAKVAGAKVRNRKAEAKKAAKKAAPKK